MSAPSQNPAAQPEVGASTLTGHPEVAQEKVPAPAAAGPETTEKAAPAAEKKAGRFDKTFVRPLSPRTVQSRRFVCRVADDEPTPARPPRSPKFFLLLSLVARP